MKNIKKIIVISGVIISFLLVSSCYVLYGAVSESINACEIQQETIWFPKVAMPVDVGYVTSAFNQVDESHSEPHNGVDIAAIGNAYAVVDGVAVANFYNRERGYVIAIAFKASDHQYYTYMYQHLALKSPILVGDTVKLGQVIGQVGNSGHSFGIHLHAEVEFARMIEGKPYWKGTYPTNPDIMFDFIDFFQLPKQFNTTAKENMNKDKNCRVQLKGKSNEEKAWRFLIQEGFTKEGAAGVIGNLRVESNLNPLAGEIGGSGGGRGIAQWGQCGLASNGASAGCRWLKLERWAQKMKLNPDELGTQLRYLILEMKEYQILEYFKQTRILYFPNQYYGGGSVGYFAEKFERPSLQYAHMNRRYAYAKEILEQFEHLI